MSGDMGTQFKLLLVIMVWTALLGLDSLPMKIVRDKGAPQVGVYLSEYNTPSARGSGDTALWSNIKYLAVKNWYLYKVRG